MRYFTLLALLATCVPHPLNSDPPEEPPVVEIEATVEYNRSDWGRWNDADHDCQDTRQEVLILESLDPVVLDDKGCRVLSGRWTCPFTGNTFTDPGLLDIDHLVALRAAHDAGGALWDEARKRDYFNSLGYPNHLIAVDRSANRSKGSRTPSEWMPPNEAFHCEYLRSWVTVKRIWELEMTCEESEDIANLMSTACPVVAIDVPPAP